MWGWLFESHVPPPVCEIAVYQDGMFVAMSPIIDWWAAYGGVAGVRFVVFCNQFMA